MVPKRKRTTTPFRVPATAPTVLDGRGFEPPGDLLGRSWVRELGPTS